MYNREKVYDYAKKWAYGRNPKFYNYDPVGGDCTNFVSQCIYAGCNQMNYSQENGWYYINGNNKSSSWTGVEFLYKFLITNRGVGPRGKTCEINQLEIGDVIQLSVDGIKYYHSLIVVQNGTNRENTLIASHTFDNFGKRLIDYGPVNNRCIHVI